MYFFLLCCVDTHSIFAEDEKDKFIIPDTWDLKGNSEDIQSALDALVDKTSSYQKLSVVVNALKEASQSDKAAEKLRERRRNLKEELSIKEALQIMDLIKLLEQSTTSDQDWLITKISEITIDSSNAETLVRFLLDQQELFSKENQKIRQGFLQTLRRSIKSIPTSSTLIRREEMETLIGESKLGEQEKTYLKRVLSQ